MTQTAQDKTGIWAKRGNIYSASPLSAAHGDIVTLLGNGFGSSNSITGSAMMGGFGSQVETLSNGTNLANGNGWTFNDTSDYPKVYTDASRGKVMLNDYPTQVDACKIWDGGAPIAPNTKYYARWYMRNTIMDTDGVTPYTGIGQLKELRVINSTGADKLTDNKGSEIVEFNWQASSPHIRVESDNINANAQVIYTGMVAAEWNNPNWALMEYFVDTGTQGSANGTLIHRVHKNGTIYQSVNRVGDLMLYNSAFRHQAFNWQHYYGNLAGSTSLYQRKTFTDDLAAQIGSWKRVELTNNLDLSIAKREYCPVISWSDTAIKLQINKGGLTAGTYYLCAVDGLNTLLGYNVWDIS